MKTLALGVAIAGLFAASAVAASRQDSHEMPKPGKEHELLKAFEGEWDVVAKFWMEPGKDPMVTKGTESAKLSLNGFWLLADFKGEMMGQPFMGKVTFGYSPFKKKYVSTWVDSSMPHLFLAEGDVDKTGKVWTFDVDSVDPMSGKPVKEKWMQEIKDKDTKVMTFWMTKDGKEIKTGEITYVRKK